MKKDRKKSLAKRSMSKSHLSEIFCQDKALLHIHSWIWWFGHKIIAIQNLIWPHSKTESEKKFVYCVVSFLIHNWEGGYLLIKLFILIPVKMGTNWKLKSARTIFHGQIYRSPIWQPFLLSFALIELVYSFRVREFHYLLILTHRQLEKCVNYLSISCNRSNRLWTARTCFFMALSIKLIVSHQAFMIIRNS